MYTTENNPAVEDFFQCVSAVTDHESRQQIVPNLKRRLENPPASLISTVLAQHMTDYQVMLLFRGFPPSAATAINRPCAVVCAPISVCAAVLHYHVTSGLCKHLQRALPTLFAALALQVRRLLFFPEASDMALYPALLAGDPANPGDLTSNAANKVRERHVIQAAISGIIGWFCPCRATEFKCSQDPHQHSLSV